jgi:DNA-binding transcriptional regulator GbsR (MarR family)
MALTKAEEIVSYILSQSKGCVYTDEQFSKILAILFLANRPLSINDIIKKTSIPKTSAFLKIKKLQADGVIKSINKPKTKEVYYYVEQNIGKIIAEHIELRYRNLVSMLDAKIVYIIEYLSSKKLTKEEKIQLKKIKKYQQDLEDFSKKINKFFLEAKK